MKYKIILLITFCLLLTGCNVSSYDSIRQDCIDMNINSTEYCSLEKCLYLNLGSNYNGYEDRVIAYKNCEIRELEYQLRIACNVE